MSQRPLAILLAILLVGLLGSLFVGLATPVAAGEDPPTLAASIRGELVAAIDELEETGDFEAARVRLDEAFDQVIAYAGDDEKALFRDAALARRVVHQLGAVDASLREDLLPFLRANPTLSRSLAFLIAPGEKPADVYKTLDRLRRTRGDHLEAHAELAAAICVVHDRPFSRRVNENRTKAVDAVLLFDYFDRFEDRMLYGVRDVPPELLIYVVDSTAGVDEMVWALDRYAGDRNVGRRFFDIDYDLAHFRRGAPKKVTEAGFTLPNILQHGGVCADQAYFAMTVGKSIGVPTAYTSGKSSRVGHAWVGFLQSNGKRAWWNFDTGRYEAYQGVRGNVLDPQTRKRIPDSYISLLADFVKASELDRQFAMATNDAADRLAGLRKSKRRLPPPPLELEDLATRRTTSIADELALLELGLRACPGNRESWFTVRDLSQSGDLTLADKKKWAGVLHKLCGEWYPDFYLAIIAPMIETVDEVKEQNALWNAAFDGFGRRKDLAADVRTRQAKMWLASGDPKRAGRCYEDVIQRYANDGPFVITALEGAEGILRDAGAGRRVLTLYQQTWGNIRKPKDMSSAFFRQSTWYRVGKMYADRLNEAGMRADAQAVLRQING